MAESARVRKQKAAPSESAPLRGSRGGDVAPDLDRLIHERVRLGIVSALSVNRKMSFNDLKAALDVTDGNLSVHARKLEEAGYVTCEKSFRNRVPHTVYALTPSGHRALRRYLEHMEALIRTVRGE